MRTRIIALASSKGGTGKTTLSAALAVRAAKESKRVALLDADPQASLERWWQLRSKPDNPKILELPCSTEGIELAIAEGWEWVIIDTPPGIVDLIQAAVLSADFVLIPSRPSAVDLEAMEDIIQICRDLNLPHAFVLNQVVPDSRIAAHAREYLAARAPVFDATVAFRNAYINAMGHGLTGPELMRASACAAEIDALWAEMKKRMASA